MGALLTGFLASNSANGNLALNLKGYVTDAFVQPLVIEQLKAMGFTIALSVVGTIVIAYIVKSIVGLRPDHDEELQGLDLVDHGEQGYHYVD